MMSRDGPTRRWPAWFWRSPRPPRPPRPWVRRLGWAGVAALGAWVAAIAMLPLPAPAAPRPTTLYGDRGRVLAHLYERNRVPVSLAQVPTRLRQAVVASEDANFYRDFGINPRSILRAAWVDVRAHRIVEGGSTIAQQLAKTLFLSPARTWSRKALEVMYTLKLEAAYTKPEILNMYLNNVYFGDGAWGVGAAARAYFGRSVSQLDLAQSALLAGLIRAPEVYSPLLHPGRAREVRRQVLGRMAAVGDITHGEATAAAEEPLGVVRQRRTTTNLRSYVLDYVLGQVAAAHPDLAKSLYRGGYRVYTTVDLDTQEAAERAFSRYMPPARPDAHGIAQPEGALVAIDPANGAIRALIGGRGSRGDTFDRAVDAYRQPGSTFKAFLYTAVVDAGYTVVDRQLDAPVSYPGANGQTYRPTDYGSQPYLNRELTVREALALSDNVVAVKWAALIGPSRVIRFARKMGIGSPLKPTLPLVLGAYDVTPLELADAYVPLANLGRAVAPWVVRTVIGPDGRPIAMPAPPRPHAVLDPGVAYIVTSLLESVMTEGTGKKLLPIVGDRPAAGKTGTTNNLKDAWFVGYTPDLVAAVWVGDDFPHRMPNGYGSVLAGPVWAHFMAGALRAVEPRDWPQPSDVTTVRVSAADGLLPNPTSPTVAEVFLRGTAPSAVSPIVAAPPPAPGGEITPPGDLGNPPEAWPPPLLEPPGVPPVARAPRE